jgi:hypothetical protein
VSRYSQSLSLPGSTRSLDPGRRLVVAPPVVPGCAQAQRDGRGEGGVLQPRLRYM